MQASQAKNRIGLMQVQMLQVHWSGLWGEERSMGDVWVGEAEERLLMMGGGDCCAGDAVLRGSTDPTKGEAALPRESRRLHFPSR